MPDYTNLHERPALDAATTPASRRRFVLASLSVLLTGCASTSRSTRLPDPAWPDDPVIARRSQESAPTISGAHDHADARDGIIPRTSWATGDPVPAMMNRMLPVRYITIHHAGMTAFYETQQQSVAGRLDAIRNAHRGQDWGDIGYHFAIDRAGRIWQCRAIEWQGAHVGGHNEGNVGILNLGNFDLQSPSEQQISTLATFVRRLQAEYRVPSNRVMTHQEWSATRCPGATLQRQMNTLRSNGVFA